MHGRREGGRGGKEDGQRSERERGGWKEGKEGEGDIADITCIANFQPVNSSCIEALFWLTYTHAIKTQSTKLTMYLVMVSLVQTGGCQVSPRLMRKTLTTCRS